MGRREISTRDAPAPAGHYAQAVLCNGLVFASGQLPLRPGGDVPDSFDEQVRIVLQNVSAVLAAAGVEMSALVKVTAYIIGVERWAEFNQIYAELLGDVRPARTVVPVAELRHGCLVEVDAIAALEARA